MACLTRAAALALTVLGATRAGAQRVDTLPIDTDRPDFTDGTTTVARHRLQLETGYTYQQGRGDDPSQSHSFPEALLRLGLSDHIELRIGQSYLSQRPEGPNMSSVNGLEDLYIGTKIGLADQAGARPALSMEASTTLPTGGDSLSAHKLLPGAALLLGWSLPGPWSAGIEFAGNREAGDYTQFAASLSIQYSAATHVQLYGEWFTFQPVDAGSGVAAQHYADTGVQVLLSNNVQVDARVGFGLNNGADRLFTGVGFAIRR